MSQQKRIDKILEEARERTQTEISALIGASFSFTAVDKAPLTKESCLDELTGTQVCAHIDIDGEASGKTCLFIGVKDAIRIGGTLIMLPESELDELVSQENYTEDIEDSFGEIANILCGSYTKVFEDNYPRSCRFIRKEQELVKPAKIDSESDELIKNQLYYRVSSRMELAGNELGELIILLPATTFDLSWDDIPDSAVADGKPELSVAQEEPVQAEEQVTEAATTEAAPQVSGDPKKNLKRIDAIIDEVCVKAPDDIGALLGAPLKFAALDKKPVTKEECFDSLTGKQVCTHIDIDGEVNGKSCMFLGIKGAIALGGTLIMLPESELDEVVSQENYSEDLEDSYGEIANILMGVYTKSFEDNFPKNCRLIRKEQEVIKPAKIDVDSDELIANQLYYQVTHSLELNDKSVGDLVVLLPAATFGLFWEEKSEAIPELQQVEQPATPSAPEPAPAAPATPPFDADKNRQQLDKLLTDCFDRLSDELTTLLAVDVKVSDLKNDFTKKEDFFLNEVQGKQVVADLEITGEIESMGYLVCSVKDAIYTGGVLVMLPPSELELVVQNEEFDADAEDAYGEIANIITGVYSGIFEEEHQKKIRLIRRDMSEVAPAKVDVDSEEPIPDIQYYWSSFNVSVDGKELGRLQLLLPAEELELVFSAEAMDATQDTEVSSQEPAPAQPLAQLAGSDPSGAYDVLIVSNSPGDSQVLSDTLKSKGYAVGVIGFGDNVYDYIPGKLKIIYLVMNEVNEQAFGVVIKLTSGISIPLVAAAPAWTRSKVIKAVKYGVKDILVTPAQPADIDENINRNIIALAA